MEGSIDAFRGVHKAWNIDADGYDKAINLLHDYACQWLEKGISGFGDTQKRKERAHAAANQEKRRANPARSTKYNIAAERTWYAGKLREWRKAGRLHRDGFLRRGAKQGPWTLARIQRQLPHLSFLDSIATLIELDGTMEGIVEETKQYISQVIEEIVDHRIRLLFAGVLVEVRRPAGGYPTGEPTPTTVKPSVGNGSVCKKGQVPNTHPRHHGDCAKWLEKQAAPATE